MSRNITISDEDLIAASRIPLPPSPPPMDLDTPITRPHLTARRHGPSITLRPQLQAGPHVPVVLSEFWVDEPHIWFSQTEAKFRRSRVTSSQAKFDHVVTKLSAAVLPTIRDLLRNLPPDAVDPYERLKERLLQHYAPSRWAMANRLLNFPPQGDQKPSAMMDRMLGYLPPGDSPDTLFQAIFLNRLPTASASTFPPTISPTCVKWPLWQIACGQLDKPTRRQRA